MFPLLIPPCSGSSLHLSWKVSMPGVWLQCLQLEGELCGLETPGSFPGSEHQGLLQVVSFARGSEIMVGEDRLREV